MIRLVSVSLITSAFMVALLAAADDPPDVKPKNLPGKGEPADVKKDEAPRRTRRKGTRKKPRILRRKPSPSPATTNP